MSHAVTATLCRIFQCTPVLSGSCPMLKANENLQLDILPANLSQCLNAAKGLRSEYQVLLIFKAEAKVGYLLYPYFDDYNTPPTIIQPKNNWARGGKKFLNHTSSTILFMPEESSECWGQNTEDRAPA